MPHDVFEEDQAPVGAIPTSALGAAGGVGTLDGTGRQPIAQTPSSAVTVSSGTAPQIDAGAQVDQQLYYFDGASGQIKSKVISTGGVTTFNTRSGAVVLSKADVTGTGLAWRTTPRAASATTPGSRSSLARSRPGQSQVTPLSA